MVRTQIQLSEDRYKQIREVAVRQGRSMADCIREGIDLFLSGSRRKAEDLSDVAGRFKAISPKGLKDHDIWWSESLEPAQAPQRRKK